MVNLIVALVSKAGLHSKIFLALLAVILMSIISFYCIAKPMIALGEKITKNYN